MNPKLHQLRSAIFARLELSSNEADALRGETLLIHDDHFYGHRFQLGQLKAVLTNEDKRVKFYNSTGRVVSDITVSELFEQAAPDRRAA